VQGVANSSSTTRRLLQVAADNVTVYYDVGGVPEGTIDSLPKTLNASSTLNTFRQLLVSNGAGPEPIVACSLIGRIPGTVEQYPMQSCGSPAAAQACPGCNRHGRALSRGRAYPDWLHCQLPGSWSYALWRAAQGWM
jgi:hypothetical protein